jgi:hypothetical protein
MATLLYYKYSMVGLIMTVVMFISQFQQAESGKAMRVAPTNGASYSEVPEAEKNVILLSESNMKVLRDCVKDVRGKRLEKIQKFIKEHLRKYPFWATTLDNRAVYNEHLNGLKSAIRHIEDPNENEDGGKKDRTKKNSLKNEEKLLIQLGKLGYVNFMLTYEICKEKLGQIRGEKDSKEAKEICGEYLNLIVASFHRAGVNLDA